MGRPKDIRVIIRREDRINYIKSKLVLYYGVPFNTLVSYHRKPSLVQKKRMCIKVLKDIGDLSLKEVMLECGMRTEGNVWCHYYYITDQIDFDKSLKQTYQEITNNIIYNEENSYKKTA